MLDIHSHILPDLDDGPAALEEAVEMAREAVRAGVSGVVATPHAFSPFFEVSPLARDMALARFSRELEGAGVSLPVFPGFECYAVENLVERIEAESAYLMPTDLLGNGKCRYVLLELGAGNPVECLDSLLFDCQLQGIVPILAHPERIPEVRRNPRAIEPFVRKGGEIQITAGCLTGIRQMRSRRVCEFLLKNELVAYIASDAHCQQDYVRLGKAMRRVGGSWW